MLHADMGHDRNSLLWCYNFLFSLSLNELSSFGGSIPLSLMPSDDWPALSVNKANLIWLLRADLPADSAKAEGECAAADDYRHFLT